MAQNRTNDRLESASMWGTTWSRVFKLPEKRSIFGGGTIKRGGRKRGKRLLTMVRGGK